ncbi:poly(A) polymerase [Candidatus Photodesmus katoptron]|uniref:Poly(A) polymerase I n=1 Tax=Candidatus Photodesmus katoptron Akat1 TaxID=1236703 RepID=S3DJW8_9GAMM|nr:poly A polymerase head protein [Candidatus Photodesmus katoptron Akat1]KEY90214.1 poly(A) polymerase [Candidatus Photodesmus katoptron]
MTKKHYKQNNHPVFTLKIITHTNHNISQKEINRNALKVLQRLLNAGFEVYLVGGSVRDLLLKKKPKDFDITTNATPEQVKHLFKNCRLIGRRFRLAHIIFGREIIEVATFRGHHKNLKKNISMQSKKGILLRDNVYGKIHEDVERRDFTINAMYYNIKDYSIHDYFGGISDLKNKVIRLIGNPKIRYREDPVRILRAIRFSVKLNFHIEKDTAQPIQELSYLLKEVPAARLYEESLKLLQSGYGLKTYHLMRQYNLFQQLFPITSSYFTKDYSSYTEKMLSLVLNSTDLRIEAGKRINPAFMFVAILWYPLNILADELAKKNKLAYYDAIIEAGNVILHEQAKTIAIPRRHTETIREIWQLQLCLPRRRGNQAFRLMELNKFRASFDFLEMRGVIEGKEIEELSKWWLIFQNAGSNIQESMISHF